MHVFCKMWQVANQMFPFLLEEVRRWPCGHGDIASQLAAANEDRFLAKWLAEREIGIENNTNNCEKQLSGEAQANSPAQASSTTAAPVGAAEKEKVVFTSCPGCFQTKMSPESHAVLTAARTLYREFHANITHTPWMDWKIETWDVGYYQIRNAMKDFSGWDAHCPSLRAAHETLRTKLLPQVYSLGFLNPDVEYFK